MLDGKFYLLIVDDEVRMTKALADFFKAKGFAVLLASNGEQALQLYYQNNQQLDLILLDVMMPKLDGMAVLSQLRAHGDDIPVILLTAKSQEEDQLQGFGLGSDDYVVKPFSPSLLLARVQTVLKRAGKSTAQTIRIADMVLDLTNSNLTFEDPSDDTIIELKRREFDLLHYLMLNKNLTLTRERLLDQVWGYDFDGDIRTVDTHIKQLRILLKQHASVIKTVHRVGYRFEVPEA